MVLCWERSGRVPPVSVHLQSCDEWKGSFAGGCEAKRWSHRTCSSLGTIFQPMRINSILDVKCFCNNKNVLCVQSMVWQFVRHPVFIPILYMFRVPLCSSPQPMRINSVLDVKCFCNNKNVLCVQSMVWQFVRHPVFIPILYMFRVPLCSSPRESIVLIRHLVYVTLLLCR